MIKETIINREHKDTLFHVLFNDKKEALSLYNAVNHTNYNKPDELIFNTLEDVIYIGMKNDISFLIGHTMNLYEHQSTWNPNMPLRGLFYLSELYQGYVEEQQLDIYGSTLLQLPMPQYVVFYNGTVKQPDSSVLRLSDAFSILEGKKSCLECEVLMLNINIGHNKELMEHCRKLHEYAIFIGKIRTNTAKGMTLKAAVSCSVDECIEEDVLADFLRKHRAEVCRMILREYDEAAHIANEKQISYEAGIELGKEEVLALVIQELLESGKSEEEIIKKLVTYYHVSEEKTREYISRCR